MNTYDILIPGHYFCDIIFTGIPDFPQLGKELYTQDLNIVAGGVLNTVVGLTRLGIRVAWLGALGNDFFSTYIEGLAHNNGIDTGLLEKLDRPFKRVTVALSYPEDRAFVSYVDPVPDLINMIYAQLDNVQPKILHFTGLKIDERMPQLIHDCHQRGILVSMDSQYREVTLDSPFVYDIISNLDIFMPNSGEAQKLTDTDNLLDAAKILNQLVPYLIIKDGINGAHAWYKNQYFHAPTIEITEIVDTTGAGDSFNAGFFAAYFAGHSPLECLQWGNIAGGLSLKGYGGTTASPTLDELKAHL